MNSYAWRLSNARGANRAVGCLILWAIVARMDEAAALFVDGHVSPARIVNRPMGHVQLLDAMERVIQRCTVYTKRRKTECIEKLREQFPPPDRTATSKPRKIYPENFGELVTSEAIEGITAVACGEWLFQILEDNIAFAKRFFKESFFSHVVSHSTRAMRLERFTEHFYRVVVRYLLSEFESSLDEVEMADTLKRARMVGILPTMWPEIKAGSQEEFLARISYVLFALEKRICPRIYKTYPVHFSAWSLAHICVATDEHDSMSSNLFVVGRESRGAGTRDHGDNVRVVRDAVFSFVPNRQKEQDTSDPDGRFRYGGYVSSEDRIGYWLNAFPSVISRSKNADTAPPWWEYSGRSWRTNTKLFLFSQHVEPRSRSDGSREPRIFNALMLGHIRSPDRGHLPAIWIAVVKRLKNHKIGRRADNSWVTGFWRGAEAVRDDTADIVFTSECLCFHGRLDEMTELYHHCGLVGRIDDQTETSEAISTVLNLTYGFDEDISDSSMGFPMQLSAKFFVVSKSENGYRLIDDVFFQRATLI